MHKFVAERVCKVQGSLLTLQQAKDDFKGSEHFNGKLKTLKTDLEKALGTVCLDHKRGPNGTRLRYVFEGFALVARDG